MGKSPPRVRGVPKKMLFLEMLSQIFEPTQKFFCENWEPKGEIRAKKGNFLGDLYFFARFGKQPYLGKISQKNAFFLFFLGGEGVANPAWL